MLKCGNYVRSDKKIILVSMFWNSVDSCKDIAVIYIFGCGLRSEFSSLIISRKFTSRHFRFHSQENSPPGARKRALNKIHSGSI